jgi:hypothetical protein
MSANAQQQQSRSFAGYRPLVPPDITSVSTLGYVAVAAAFGMIFGLVLAVFAGHAHVATAPSPLASQGAGATRVQETKATLRPSRSAHARRRRRAAANRLGQPSSHAVVLKQASFHRKREVFKYFDWQKNSREHKVNRIPYVSPHADPQTPAAEPTALQLATAAAANGPFFLGIQGDATVASYDAATGTVQTYEGATYVLAKASVEAGTISWESYPFHVHYRCDEAGNCTLNHGGASAIAKLAR